MTFIINLISKLIKSKLNLNLINYTYILILYIYIYIILIGYYNTEVILGGQ